MLENVKHTVQVVLFNDKGQILCVSRKDNHSDFGLIGGKLDDGETLEEGIIREAFEETGLTVSNVKEIYCYSDGSKIGHTFVGEWEGDISTEEKGLVKWGTFSDIIAGSFGDWNLIVKNCLVNLGIIENKYPFLRKF
jgi:8-oxo-dGTP pyrophosphatase MutT (NUDIX family)